MANDVTRSNGYSQQWANPLFSTYGNPLSQAMTAWLYGDQQSNPYATEPTEWPRSGRVAFIDRSLTFTLSAAKPTVITTANLGGGKNILVFSRSANYGNPLASFENYTPIPVPNDALNLVTCRIQRQDGFIDMETAPINNNFGTAGRPFIRPAPEFWLGNQSREFTVGTAIPLGENTLDITLTFQIALLDTGR